jgi:hypothetical protein
MRSASPSGKAAAGGMIVGAKRCDSRRERRYPGLAPLPSVRSIASLVEFGLGLIEATLRLR